MDSKNVIDITSRLKTVQSSNAQPGINVLNSLPTEDAHSVIEFVISYVFTEVKVGLGLIDLPEGDEDTELHIFNKIADIYEEAAGNCYFCSESVDPNEDEFNTETELCMMCKLKLANYTEALGIPASKVFKGLSTRAQKTRIFDENQNNKTE